MIDWATGLGTVVAMELIGRKRWEGWLVGLGHQALRRWRRDHRALASCRDDVARGDGTPRQDDHAPRRRISGGAA